MKLVLSATASSLLLSSAAYAQTAPPPSITAHATAQIAAPLQVQCTAMHFSSLAAQHVATSVTLPADGSPILDPNKILIGGRFADPRSEQDPDRWSEPERQGLGLHRDR